MLPGRSGDVSQIAPFPKRNNNEHCALVPKWNHDERAWLQLWPEIHHTTTNSMLYFGKYGYIRKSCQQASLDCGSSVKMMVAKTFSTPTLGRK